MSSIFIIYFLRQTLPLVETVLTVRDSVANDSANISPQLRIKTTLTRIAAHTAHPITTAQVSTGPGQ